MLRATFYRPRLALLLLLALLSACGTVAPATPGPTGGKPIQIGASLPLSGRYAVNGAQLKIGYEMAVEAINKAGGVRVNGQMVPLELTEFDDESDPTKTVQRLETLNSSNHVAAYLGTFSSDLNAAAAAIAEKNKIPYVGVAYALLKLHQLGYKYLFSPYPKSPDYVKIGFDLLDSLDPKPTRLALFTETTDWGAEMEDLWNKQAQARGYEIVVAEHYAPGNKDYASLISKAKTANAEALLTQPSSVDAIAMVKQLKELEWTPQVTMIVRGAESTTWVSNLGKVGDYIVLPSAWSLKVDFPGAQDLIKRYQEKYNDPPLATMASGYVAAQILADAITRANSSDSAAIRNALASTDLQDTVFGRVRFNPDGTGIVNSFMNQYQDGKIVNVWPPSQVASKMLYPAKPFSER